MLGPGPSDIRSDDAVVSHILAIIVPSWYRVTSDVTNCLAIGWARKLFDGRVRVYPHAIHYQYAAFRCRHALVSCFNIVLDLL